MASRLSYRVLSVDVGERNLGVAIVAVAEGRARLEYLGVHDVLTTVGCAAKCRSVTKVDSVRHMCTFLATRQAEWRVDAVTDFVVEGQVRASPKNQCLTAALFAWFTLATGAASPDSTAGGQTNPRPRMASVAAKNKGLDSPAAASPAAPAPVITKATKGKAAGKSAAGKGSAYRARKKNAVATLEGLLASGKLTPAAPDVLAQWRAAKKQDDMADAALQALWYIEHRLKTPLTVEAEPQ
jgi:hypothetical protein